MHHTHPINPTREIYKKYLCENLPSKLNTSIMNKKHYQTPETEVIKLQQEGIICASDTLRTGTGAIWGYEEADSDEGFIL